MFTLRILDIKVQWQKKILLLKLFEQQHTQVFLNKIFRRLKKGFRIVIYIENIIYYRNGHIVAISVSRTCTSGRFFLFPFLNFFPEILKFNFFFLNINFSLFAGLKEKNLLLHYRIKKKELYAFTPFVMQFSSFPPLYMSIDLHF